MCFTSQQIILRKNQNCILAPTTLLIIIEFITSVVIVTGSVYAGFYCLYISKRIQLILALCVFRLHTEAPGGCIRCRAAQTQAAASVQPGGL